MQRRASAVREWRDCSRPAVVRSEHAGAVGYRSSCLQHLANAAAGRLDYEEWRIAACPASPFPPERLIVLPRLIRAAHAAGWILGRFQPDAASVAGADLVLSLAVWPAAPTSRLNPLPGRRRWMPMSNGRASWWRQRTASAGSDLGDTLPAVFGLVGDRDPRASASAAARVALRPLHAMTRDPARLASLPARAWAHTAQVWWWTRCAAVRSAATAWSLVRRCSLQAHLPARCRRAGRGQRVRCSPSWRDSLLLIAWLSAKTPDGDAPMTYHLCGPSRANE